MPSACQRLAEVATQRTVVPCLVPDSNEPLIEARGEVDIVPQILIMDALDSSCVLSDEGVDGPPLRLQLPFAALPCDEVGDGSRLRPTASRGGWEGGAKCLFKRRVEAEQCLEESGKS